MYIITISTSVHKVCKNSLYGYIWLLFILNCVRIGD
nr:MAG TPA: hypothetical protein [Caudoviricetes sp.]